MGADIQSNAALGGEYSGLATSEFHTTKIGGISVYERTLLDGQT
jgi:hypothetical protein